MLNFSEAGARERWQEGGKEETQRGRRGEQTQPEDLEIKPESMLSTHVCITPRLTTCSNGSHMDLKPHRMLKAQFLQQLLYVWTAFEILKTDLKANSNAHKCLYYTQVNNLLMFLVWAAQMDLKWISNHIGCSRHSFYDNFCMSDLNLRSWDSAVYKTKRM